MFKKENIFCVEFLFLKKLQNNRCLFIFSSTSSALHLLKVFFFLRCNTEKINKWSTRLNVLHAFFLQFSLFFLYFYIHIRTATNTNFLWSRSLRYVCKIGLCIYLYTIHMQVYMYIKINNHHRI